MMHRRDFLSRGGLALPAVGASFARPASAMPVPGVPPAVVNVRDHGATGDGRTLDTRALQAAIEACGAGGGGTVYLPSGTYLSSTLVLKSNMTLHLESGAVLLGSTDLADFPSTRPAYRSYIDGYTERSLIYAERLENIAVVGRGAIDGQGGSFPRRDQPSKERPYMMRIVECRNVTVRDVTLRNSPMWVQHYLACENVTIDGITVLSRDVNLNNDGVDVDSCSGVRISNCWIDTGDDCIVLKSTSPRPCQDVAVTNCVLSSKSNAFKCGTESTGGFRNIAVSNCVMRDTRLSGIALEIVDGGHMNTIAVSNVVMQDVANPVFIRLGNRARPYREGIPKPGVGTLRNVQIRGIHATGVGNWVEQPSDWDHRQTFDPRIGCSITGLPGHVVENVSLTDVRLAFRGGGRPADADREIPDQPAKYPDYHMFGITPAYGFFCRHVRGLKLRDVQLAFEEPDGRPALFCDDVEDLRVAGLEAQLAPDARAVIWLREVRDAFIHGNAPTSHARALAYLAGEGTRDVTLLGNALSRSTRPFLAAPEVRKDGVRAAEAGGVSEPPARRADKRSAGDRRGRSPRG